MQKSSNVVEIAILHHPPLQESYATEELWYFKHILFIHTETLTLLTRNASGCAIISDGLKRWGIVELLTCCDQYFALVKQMEQLDDCYAHERARQVSERLWTRSKETYAISDRLQTHHQNAPFAHVFTCGLSERAEHASCNMADVTATDDGKLSKKWVSFSALSPFKWW